jgi:hypothetical protein
MCISLEDVYHRGLSSPSDSDRRGVPLTPAPCPLRVSRPGADRAERAAQAAVVSVQCELQVLALQRSLGPDRHAGENLCFPIQKLLNTSLTLIFFDSCVKHECFKQTEGRSANTATRHNFPHLRQKRVVDSRGRSRGYHVQC